MNIVIDILAGAACAVAAVVLLGFIIGAVCTALEG